jgi:hypothetical protein
MAKNLELGDRDQAASKCCPQQGQTAIKLERSNLYISPQLDKRIFMQIYIEILINKTEFEFKLA